MNKIAIKVRDGKISDIYDIYRLNKECLPIYYSIYEHLMMMYTYKYKVIDFMDKIIGFTILEDNDKKLHIISIGISEKYRNKGLGTYLLNKIKKTNSKPITLNVHIENDTAIKFYIKNGFRIIKTLNDYYSSKYNYETRNAYLMMCESNSNN